VVSEFIELRSPFVRPLFALWIWKLNPYELLGMFRVLTI